MKVEHKIKSERTEMNTVRWTIRFTPKERERGGGEREKCGMVGTGSIHPSDWKRRLRSFKQVEHEDIESNADRQDTQ